MQSAAEIIEPAGRGYRGAKMKGMSQKRGETEGLVLADSFRVRLHPDTGAGEVRGLWHHVARFARGVLEIDEQAARGIGNFIDETGEQIAHYAAQHGGAFPRWELWLTADGSYSRQLSLRPLPELGETLGLVSAPGAALPNAPRKGPNIARYAALNRDAGAEALLVDDDGRVREGATTSIVWWRGEQAHISAARDRVASVTEALLGEILREHSISLTRAEITPEVLTSYEVWAVNALHGVRPVTSIDGTATPAVEAERLARVRAALDQTWQPFPPVER